MLKKNSQKKVKGINFMCWYRKQDLIIFVLNIFTILVIRKKIEFIFLAISKTFLFFFFFNKANDVTAKSGLIMKKKNSWEQNC